MFSIAVIILFLSLFRIDECESHCLGRLSEIEYHALESFFNALNGSDWRWKQTAPIETRWTFSGDLDEPCTLHWQGLNCSESYSSIAECSVESIDLNAYRLAGRIPHTISNFSSLKSLNLASNRITNSIPTSLWKLHNLTYLELSLNFLSGPFIIDVTETLRIESLLMSLNRFTGALPSELGLLTSLRALDFQLNLLRGSIPSELGSLTNLQYLYLQSNFIVGIIPASLSDISPLIVLDLSENFLSGSIPSELGLLSELQQLNLQENQLDGSLPSQLGMLSSLTSIFIDATFISHTLPSELLLLGALEQLSATGAALTGPLPSQWAGLTSLTNLLLDGNYFSSSIPTGINRLPKATEISFTKNLLTGPLPPFNAVVVQLVLSMNAFSGPIPGQFADLLNVTEIYLDGNILTGTIPSNIGNLEKLLVLALNDNYLTGSLPAGLPDCSLIKSMDFSDNLLTGTIDVLSAPKLTGLASIAGSSNFMSGSLPYTLQTPSYLSSVVIADNYLSGSIPAGWNNLNRMQMFNMSFNLLSGSLDVFLSNSSGLRDLSFLDASNNALTGQLPDSLFHSGRTGLETIILYNNCFEGSLSSAICDLRSLSILVLDSLTTASQCHAGVSAGMSMLIKGVFARHVLEGGIPECMWSMPLLTTLHLSGNGLTGRLPELPGNSSLTDVSMSNNNLVGTLPTSWQTHDRFSKLDLSSNRLEGTLSASFVVSPNSTLVDLTVNRLSGDIPVGLMTAIGTTILDGNLFQCEASSKPEYDPDSAEYVCGSNDLDYSLLSWTCVVGVLLVIVCVAYRSESVAIYARCNDISTFLLSCGYNLSKTASLLHVLRQICDCILSLTCGYVLVALVSYSVLKLGAQSSQLSTHTFQYGWVPTAAFLHGAVPTALVVFYLWTSVVVLARMFKRRSRQHDGSETAKVDGTSDQIYRVCTISVVVSVHVCVVVSVNVLYVYALSVGLSTDKLLCLQFGLSLSKYLWSNVVLIRALRRINFASASQRLVLSSLLSLVTYLLGPMLATLLSDDTCFRYVITGTPQVSSVIQVKQYQCYTKCDFVCTIYCGLTFFTSLPMSTVASPAWLYSFQCSSVLLVNYIPVLVFVYLISGVLRPLARVVYSSLETSTIEHWTPEVVRRLFLSHGLLLLKVPEGEVSVPVQVPLPGAIPISRSTSGSTSISRTRDGLLLPGGPLTPLPELKSGLGLESTDTSSIKSSAIVLQFVLNLVLLLTFGLASPLLAVIIAVDTAANLLSWQLLVRRFLQLHLTHQSVSGSVNSPLPAACLSLETACSEADAGMSGALLMAVCSAGAFWSIFVFDMMGDVYGSHTGGLSLLLTTVGVLLVYLLCRHMCQVEERDEELSTKLLGKERDSSLSAQRFTGASPIQSSEYDSRFNDVFL